MTHSNQSISPLCQRMIDDIEELPVLLDGNF